MRRVLTAALTILLACALLVAPAAQSASPDLVVSQVYAGGGNTGASFTNDFVELFNRGSAAVAVDGWTIQYASASGTTWQATTLSGSVPAGGYYLVQLASAGAVGASLPTPDATGTTNLANSGGKVALARDSAPLSCGAAAGSCSAVAQVADLIGWGSAVDYEGAGPAPALGNTSAGVRATGGCTDTDANSSDFTASTPAPRNASSPVGLCGSPPPPDETVTQSAAVEVDVQPVLSLALERPTVSFGNVTAGDTPAAVSERVTVVSNNGTGYALTVHRSAFLPADLPLGIAASAPSGGQIGATLAGGAMAPIPIAPQPDLLVGTTATGSTGAGDVWPASIGFVAPLPVVAPGRYAATITFTVIAR